MLIVTFGGVTFNVSSSKSLCYNIFFLLWVIRLVCSAKVDMFIQLVYLQQKYQDVKISHLSLPHKNIKKPYELSNRKKPIEISTIWNGEYLSLVRFCICIFYISLEHSHLYVNNCTRCFKVSPLVASVTPQCVEMYSYNDTSAIDVKSIYVERYAETKTPLLNKFLMLW